MSIARRVFFGTICLAAATLAIFSATLIGLVERSHLDRPWKTGRPIARALDAMVSEKEYARLERVLPSAHLSDVERTYFTGILADRLNHPEKAIEMLQKILPQLKASSPPRAANALLALAVDQFTLGDYARSAQSFGDLRRHYLTQFDKADRQGIRDTANEVEVIRNAPPQTIEGSGKFRVPFRPDPLRDIDIPLTFGKIKQWWIFDTCANISTISMSTAKRLGLAIIKKTVETQSGATGVEVPLKLAVIPEIRFGAAAAKNVIVQIVDDKSMKFNMGKFRHYEIQGVLGYPVLRALGSFTFSGNQLTVAPQGPDSPASTNLYVDDLTPLADVTVNKRNLIFTFDTGNDGIWLTARYFRSFRRRDLVSWKKRKVGFGGLGGGRLMTVYAIPQAKFGMGGASVMARNVSIRTQDTGVEPIDHTYGVMGQGVLRNFRAYTIDFSRMRFTAR